EETGKRQPQECAIKRTQRARSQRHCKPIFMFLCVSESQSGAIIGRWLKTKNDPEGILAALEFAAANGVAEPISYVTKCLAKEPKRETVSAVERVKRMAEEARRLEDSAGIKRPSDAIGGIGFSSLDDPGFSSQGQS